MTTHLFTLSVFKKYEGFQSLVVQSTSDQFRIWHLQLLDSYRKEDPLLTTIWSVFVTIILRMQEFRVVESK